jgi:peroxiredoxin
MPPLKGKVAVVGGASIGIGPDMALGLAAASAKAKDKRMKFKPGDIFPAKTLESATGEPIKLPDPNRLVHLQFRRFVDCPICNTHIAELRRRAVEIEAAGVKEVIVFHSSAESIRSYQKDVPFVIVDDPTKALYKEFGVETSLGFMSLKALGAAMRGIAHGYFGLRPSGEPAGPSGRLFDRALRADQS